MKNTLDFQLVTKEVANEAFNCGIESINQYIKDSYFPSLTQHAYTYKVLGLGKTLAYIQFLFREVNLELFPEDISGVDPGVKDGTLTAIHIRFIAVEEKFQKHNIGTEIMRAAIRKVHDLAKEWPVRVITIDAREDLVEWYRKLGFENLLRNTEGQDGVTIAMFYDCIKQPEKLKSYLDECTEV